MLRFPKFILLPFGFIVLIGCATTPSPIKEKRFTPVVEVSSKRLMIILPGRGDTIESLEKQGFVSTFQKYYPSFETVVVDAHLGYYKKELLEQRLLDDIIIPAIKDGYKEIWMMGISLGGAGSLKIFEKHNDKITGIILISPYSGSKKFHKNLDRYLFGKQDDSLVEKLERENVFFSLWKWIINNDELMNSDRVWLGYGDQDYLKGHENLKKYIGDNKTIVIPGKHKITVFKQIWEQLLSKKPID